VKRVIVGKIVNSSNAVLNLGNNRSQVKLRGPSNQIKSILYFVQGDTNKNVTNWCSALHEDKNGYRDHLHIP